MRVLITGGAGFIGGALGHHLSKAGHHIVCVDNLSRGAPERLPATASLIEADVLHAEIDQIVRDERPDAIVHLAAQIHVRQSSEDPLLDAEQNVLGTLRLLRAAEAARVRTFVFASSGGAVYGNDVVRPTPEHAPCAPVSPYGASKLAAEQYCALYARKSTIRTVTLRLGNVYGPGQSTAGGSGVVALFLSALRAGRLPALIGEGDQTRDYVYIDDVLDAFERALICESVCGTYNIGTGRATSVKRLLNELTQLLGTSGASASLATRAFEVTHSCLDYGRAEREMGWRPRIGLKEGLRQSVERRP